MKILISNDDGVDSPGIEALANAVADLGEVVVVAPHRERSTSGHSLTLHKPLRIFKVAENRWATTGTPADCIYLGVREVLKGKPDLILCGINAGANLGTDVHYSGTVAAAREGALMNIPSYAFSLVDVPKLDREFPRLPQSAFEIPAQCAREVISMTKGIPFPSHTLLNVNIPKGETPRGIRIARQGFRYYQNEVVKRSDPRGRDYFWIGGPYMGFEKTDSSDCDAVEAGFASVTPISIDCTHQAFYAVLAQHHPVFDSNA